MRQGAPRTSQVICITGLYKRIIWIPPAASTQAPITAIKKHGGAREGDGAVLSNISCRRGTHHSGIIV